MDTIIINKLSDVKELILSGRNLDVPVVVPGDCDFSNILDFVILAGGLYVSHFERIGLDEYVFKQDSIIKKQECREEAYSIIDILHGRKFYTTKIMFYVYKSIPYDKLLQICKLIEILPSDVYKLLNAKSIPKMKPLRDKYFRYDTIVICR